MKHRMPRWTVITLLAVLSLAACGPGAGQSTHTSPAIATISARISLDAPSEHYGILVTDTAIWVHNFDSGNLLRIDPHTNQVVATIPVASGSGQVANEAGYIWTLGHDQISSSIWKVDPQTNRVVDVIALSYPNAYLVASPGAIWVVSVGTQTITRIDSHTDKVVARFSVPSGLGWISYGAGSLWVCGFLSGTVTRIEPSSYRALKTWNIGSQQGGQCDAIVALDNTVWVEANGGTMFRIDPATNTLGASPTTVPDQLDVGIAVDSHQAWVYSSSALYRLDPQTNQVTGTLAVNSGAGIELGDGAVWLVTNDLNTADPGTLLRLTPAS
jgi:streptogramin lyase